MTLKVWHTSGGRSDDKDEGTWALLAGGEPNRSSKASITAAEIIRSIYIRTHTVNSGTANIVVCCKLSGIRVTMKSPSNPMARKIFEISKSYKSDSIAYCLSTE